MKVDQVVVRPIIEINRSKCNGCGLCTTACAEDALYLDNENKAVLGKEIYCDGLGACLDVCPTGALKIVKREAAEYDSGATAAHVKMSRGEAAVKNVHGYGIEESHHAHHEGCPGAAVREIKREFTESSNDNSDLKRSPSELSQWPIQLKLVSPGAPYFKECDLLIAADCTAFSLGSFHQDLLKGKKLIIACPKLDDTNGYVQKLTEIIGYNTIYSVTVAVMTVPCCSGMYTMVEEAVARSGKNIAIKKVIIDASGEIK